MRLHAQLEENAFEFRLAQWLLGVFPVGEADTVLVEQSDRFATGASGLGADKNHGVPLLSVSSSD